MREPQEGVREPREDHARVFAWSQHPIAANSATDIATTLSFQFPASPSPSFSPRASLLFLYRLSLSRAHALSLTLSHFLYQSIVMSHRPRFAGALVKLPALQVAYQTCQ